MIHKNISPECEYEPRTAEMTEDAYMPATSAASSTHPDKVSVEFLISDVELSESPHLKCES